MMMETKVKFSHVYLGTTERRFKKLLRLRDLRIERHRRQMIKKSGLGSRTVPLDDPVVRDAWFSSRSYLQDFLIVVGKDDAAVAQVVEVAEFSLQGVNRLREFVKFRNEQTGQPHAGG